MKSKKIFSHKTRLNLIKLVVVIAGILLMLTPVAATTPQVDMYSMVTSLGLDSGEFGVRCTAEVILPEEENGAMGVSIVIDGEGQTLSSALENLSISIGRTLDLSHCAIVVVGEEKAKGEMLDDFEYLLSSNLVSPEISLVLSGNKDAKEFIEKLNEYSQKLDADNLLKYTDFGSHNFSQTLIQFIKGTYSKSKSAVMPCITMGDKSENINAVEAEEKPIGDGKADKSEGGSEGGGDSGGGSGQGGGGGGGGQGGGGGEQGGGGGKPPMVIKRTDKIGAFTGGKLKRIWGAVEGNGLAWSDNKTKHGHLILEDLTYEGQTLDTLSCYLVKKKVGIKSVLKDNVPVLQFKVDAQFVVEERYKIYRLSDGKSSDKVYDTVVEEIEKEIRRTIMTVMEKSVEDDVDAFLCRDMFYRYHKREFDKFTKAGQDVLPLTQVDIKFDIKIN